MSLETEPTDSAVFIMCYLFCYPQETGKANKNVSDGNVQHSPGG